MVTVYTKPNCMQCKMTQKFLKEHGVAFEVKSTENEAYREEVIDMGFTGLPVVVTDTDKWTGLRMDKLNGLVD